MNDDDFPPRLRTQSNDRVKRLLERVAEDGPSSERVAATVAGVAAATGAARGALGVAKWVKVVTVIGSAGLVTLAAAIAIRAAHHESAQPPPPASSVESVHVHAQAPAENPPHEIVSVPAPAIVTSEPAPIETAPVARAPVQPRATVATAATASAEEEDSSTMTIELQRVLAIRSRMLAKDPGGALSGVEQYERDYPNGSFVPEAEAMAIEALGDLGRADEAKARADRFLERYGSSPQAVRIRALREKMK